MKGRRVLVTSPDAGPLEALLAERGAVAIHVPTIDVRPVPGRALDRALDRAEEYGWIVVTSANGVAALVGRLEARGAPPPPTVRWAAVGPKTAAALEARGVAVEHVPDAGLGAAIPDGMGPLEGARVLLARAAGAGADLPRILRARGARVDDVTAYETSEGPERWRAPLASALDAGLDAAIFTSGSTVRGFVRLAGSAGALGEARVVCMGPTTTAAALRAGFEDVTMAREPTPVGLVAALETAFAGADRTSEDLP
ncbi:MAG TPA: uroporphyrinogen-III synthase [Gemmatimonadota bacterium]|nr:uroporphyrinogen-III synthase [Gemmatimonadota bacterium]